MFSFGKAKRVVNLVIDNYMIRMVENDGESITSIKQVAEKIIPDAVIENGKIVDDIAFYEFMKDVVQKWGIRQRNVRFYVPDELVIMREIQLTEEVTKEEIKQYITMEIGHTIHFPFKNPVFDLYDLRYFEEENKVTIFAAPEEEIMKYIEIFADVQLKPIAIDVKSLGVYRFFLLQEQSFQKDKVYLFFEQNLTSSNISIFHQHLIEVLRYQELNIDMNDWKVIENVSSIQWEFANEKIDLDGRLDEQFNELSQLMDFYQYSMHQGEKSIDKIILLGDYPELDDIKMKLEVRFNMDVSKLSIEDVNERLLNLSFIPVLGLALKGGKK